MQPFSILSTSIRRICIADRVYRIEPKTACPLNDAETAPAHANATRIGPLQNSPALSIALSGTIPCSEHYFLIIAYL
ncbi:MAG: hypothetical protein Q7T96_04490 [Methylobacter sp.]|nr:hypothetical protein [Methylobacter sp.]